MIWDSECCVSVADSGHVVCVVCVCGGGDIPVGDMGQCGVCVGLIVL